MIADRLQPRLRIALGDDCPDRRLTSGDAEALKLAIMRMHSDPGIPGGIRWL